MTVSGSIHVSTHNSWDACAKGNCLRQTSLWEVQRLRSICNFLWNLNILCELTFFFFFRPRAFLYHPCDFMRVKKSWRWLSQKLSRGSHRSAAIGEVHLEINSLTPGTSVGTCGVRAKSLQSCLTLCDPRDKPGSSVHGILSRQEHWSRLPFPSPRNLPYPGIESSSHNLTITGRPLLYLESHLGRLSGLGSKESACWRPGLIPGSGRSPEVGSSYPLQYSCLENPMDRGAWWATVHGVTKSQTRLSD